MLLEHHIIICEINYKTVFIIIIKYIVVTAHKGNIIENLTQSAFCFWLSPYFNMVEKKKKPFEKVQRKAQKAYWEKF